MCKQYISNPGEYDPDSSPEAWEFYKSANKVYLESLENQNLGKYCTKRYSRLFVVDNSGCRISGDVVFNFEKLKGKITKDSGPDYERLIRYNLPENRYAYRNLSLFPMEGKLQLWKGGNLDRIDVFISELYSYYNCSENKKMDHIFMKYNLGIGKGHTTITNKQILKSFLDSMGNGEEGFFNYCDKIYLMDKDLAKRMVESGRHSSINTTEKLIEYMDLAKEFWNRKKFD